MQSDDATEPVSVQELRESLDEWAAISTQMIDLLHATVNAERSRYWRPHFAQIVKAIEAFGDRCRAESCGCCAWRVDDLEPHDSFERVRAQGQRLVDWLQRMMAE